MKKRSAIAAASALLMVTALGTHGMAWNSKSYLTFSGPVRLPGVTLAGGTYSFERVDVLSHVVMVRNRATSQVCFLGFTQVVPRPRRLAENHQIDFRETARGVPPEIDVWYPAGDADGEQFVYPKGR
jgi:hypothetical protein